MATPSNTLVIRVRVAWWLRLYLAGVSLMSQITGLEPDDERTARWIRRGIKIEVAS